MTDARPSTAVVLLAGGRSRRHPDGDKALADVDGEPMCRRAVEGLPGDEHVVSCRSEQCDALESALAGLDPRFAVDPVPDRGPLAGLQTALGVATADRAVVVGCDMPLFDRATATDLLDALGDPVGGSAGGHTERAGGHTERAGRHTERAGRHTERAGRHAVDAAVVDAAAPPSPLGAAYRVAPARRACETTLACGSRRLGDALGRLDVARVDADARAVSNCNTPEDVAAATEAF